MRYHEFIDQVKSEGRLGTHHEAILTTEAVLETLGERLERTEKRKLRDELPKELQEYLFAKEGLVTSHARQHHFNLEEFYNLVSARSNLSFHGAIERTRIVMAVLKKAVSDGIINEILNRMPDEYQKLLR